MRFITQLLPVPPIACGIGRVAAVHGYRNRRCCHCASARHRGHDPVAAGSGVYFIDLKDGATVPSKLKLSFGLRNMGIAPAGTDRPNSGHHHLLIDTELPALDQPIPNDFNHLHFGAGQTETEITLKPGQHTLQSARSATRTIFRILHLSCRSVSAFASKELPKQSPSLAGLRPPRLAPRSIYRSGQGWSSPAAEIHDVFRAQEHGSCPCRNGSPECRSSSSS